MDAKQRKWIVFTAILLIAAIVVYVRYDLRAPGGPRGGSPIGLGFGVAGFALMIFAGLLSARKKVPVWRLGRSQTWMRGHLWLGLLSLPLILFHSGFHMRGTVTIILMILFFVVIASGVFGAVLQNYVPRRITTEVPMETIYAQIGHVREQLRKEADQLVGAACGPLGDTVPVTATPGSDTARTAVEVGVEISEEARAQLREFYLRQMLPFFERTGKGGHPLDDAPQAAGIFDQLRLRLPPELDDTLDDLENICEEERELTHQARMHRWLHGWLLVHVPLSFALLVLAVFHAVIALRY